MPTKKVLICDDDRILQKIVSHILVKKGLAVFLADDGEKGLASIAENAPALVILDLEMPRKNGLQVLQDLGAKGGPIPYIIVLSSHEGADKRDQALKLGAREVMQKPFNVADLLKKIEGLIEQGTI